MTSGLELKSTGRFTISLRKLVHYKHDRCSVCGRLLPRGIAAFAGYSKEGRELYVGECCKAQVSELASHIYWWWHSYKRPTPETVLMRFMDFSKLMSILTEESLYFARADTLGDPFEGARGIVSKQDEWRDYVMDYYRKLIRTPPDGSASPPEDVVEREAERLYQEVEEGGRRDIKHTYVTCWHSGAGESEALWRLYCPPQTGGVCIRTTFGDLDAALLTGEDVRFGYVQYVDYKERFAGTYDRIFWKRKSLSHEAEVRGVIQDRHEAEENLRGRKVQVVLDKLIGEIIVSPFAPEWFQPTLLATLARFGLQNKVATSELAERPFF